MITMDTSERIEEMARPLNVGIMTIEDPSLRLLAAIAKQAVVDLKLTKKPSGVSSNQWLEYQQSAREFVELNIPSAFRYI